MRKLMAGLVLLAGCGESAPPDIGTTKTEIEALVRNYHEAMNKGDLKVIGEMMAPDCSLIWSGDDPVYGSAACLKILQGFVDYHKSHDLLEKRKPLFDNIRVRQEGVIAVATYLVAFRESNEQPQELFTHIFRRESGKWLLIHDHRVTRRKQ
jgi:uncharacterized protein (TIGR02246 family)